MRRLGPVSILLSALLASASNAQAPGDAAGATSPPRDVGYQTSEIIVTAQRRSESLQKTPIAVTAVTAEAVQSLGLSEIKDIAAVTPGASFTTNSNFFAPYIRGIGTAYVSVGVEAPVAIYEDGAYLPRTLGANDLLDNFDIGSIQVLRGPQGTLYGRNATGGVVIVNSADPEPEFGARVRAGGWQS
ncbi:Plug domain-containing protein [Sphingobium sp. AN558]|uniref:TonB-dependent receptor plug domain-containing protein n=1 Tax=Sphingobium sp. AN558 TaxID=3133442 RepID=UPI0030C5F741